MYYAHHFYTFVLLSLTTSCFAMQREINLESPILPVNQQSRIYLPHIDRAGFFYEHFKPGQVIRCNQPIGEQWIVQQDGLGRTIYPRSVIAVTRELKLAKKGKRTDWTHTVCTQKGVVMLTDDGVVALNKPIMRRELTSYGKDSIFGLTVCAACLVGGAAGFYAWLQK